MGSIYKTGNNKTGEYSKKGNQFITKDYKSIIHDGDNYKLGLKNHIHPAEHGIHIAIKVKTELSEV